MADTGKSDDGPSLEMPSFSLRGRKKAAESEETPAPEATSDPTPTREATPEPAPEPEPQPISAEQPTTEQPTTEQPTMQHPAVVAPTPAPAPERHRDIADATEPVAAPKPRRELPLPALSGIPAAAATGLVVGGLALLLSWLATTGCEAVRGTSSCGGGPGFVILLAVLVLLAYAGGWLLSRFEVPDAGSTSLLAVGIMAVLVMVFLLGSIDEWWMVVAIPVVTVIGYCVSWWVTTAVTDDGATETVREPYDVR